MAKFIFLFFFILVSGGKEFAKLEIGPVYPVDIFLGLCGVIFLYKLIKTGRIEIYQGSRILIGIIIAYIVYGVILSITHSGDSLRLTLRDLTIFVYASSIIVLPYLTRREGLGGFVLALYLGSCIILGQGILNQIVGYSYVHQGRYISGQSGIYIIFAMNYLIADLVIKNRFNTRVGIYKIIFLFFLSYGIILTLHRMYLVAIVGGGMGIVVYASLLKNKILKFELVKSILVFSILLSFLILIFPSGDFFDRMLMLSADSTSVSFRATAWLLALERWFVEPWLGEGLGLPFDFLSNDTEFLDARPHNMFLTILMKSGVLGLFLFFGVLFYTIKNFCNLAKLNKCFTPSGNARVAGSFGSFVASIIIGFGNLMIESPFLAVFFWFFCGVAIIKVQEKYV